MYGQWWRFYTTTLLHANLLHLLVSPCLPASSSSSLVPSRTACPILYLPFGLLHAPCSAQLICSCHLALLAVAVSQLPIMPYPGHRIHHRPGISSPTTHTPNPQDINLLAVHTNSESCICRLTAWRSMSLVKTWKPRWARSST